MVNGVKQRSVACGLPAETSRQPYSVPGPNSLWHIGKLFAVCLLQLQGRLRRATLSRPVALMAWQTLPLSLGIQGIEVDYRPLFSPKYGELAVMCCSKPHTSSIFSLFHTPPFNNILSF